MSNDDDSLASKILLMRASNNSRAKSWLNTALGEAPNEQQAGNVEPVFSSLADIKGDDELAGIGAPKTAEGSDDVSNRQLMSANDALRRKLLSRDACQKYQQGGADRLTASKPMPRDTRTRVEVESEDEGKGRSSRASKKRAGVQAARMEQQDDHAAQEQVSAGATVVTGKKRPGSYLDQILANRGKKQKSKSKSDES